MLQSQVRRQQDSCPIWISKQRLGVVVASTASSHKSDLDKMSGGRNSGALHTFPPLALGSSLSLAWPQSAFPTPSPHRWDGSLGEGGYGQIRSTPVAQKKVWQREIGRERLSMANIHRILNEKLKKASVVHIPLTFYTDVWSWISHFLLVGFHSL